MIESEKKCPDGWEPAQILAYVDGDLDAGTSRDLEKHLATCPVCAAQMQSVQRLGDLLRRHPESFHPDAEDLVVYLQRGGDPEGRIASHLTDCARCTADLEVLREMLLVGSEIPDRRPRMPEALLTQLQEIHGSSERVERAPSVISVVADAFRTLFRAPVLALGSVAAVLILAIVWHPLQDAYNDISKKVTKPPVEVHGVELPRPEALKNESGGPPLSESMESLQFKKPLEAPQKVESRGTPLKKHDGRGAADSLSLRGAAGSSPRSKERPASPEAEDKRGSPAAAVPSKAETSGLSSEHAAPGKTAPVERQPAPQESNGIEPGVSRAPRRESPPQPAGLPAPAEKQIRQYYPHVRGAAPSTPLPPAMEVPPSTGRVESSLGDRRISVSVKVVDSSGRIVPGVSVVIPAHLQTRFRLVEQGTELERSESRAAAEKRKAGAGLKDQEEAQRLILVRLSLTEKGFDIEATLLGEVTGSKKETIRADAVSREDLDKRINEMVGTLLGKNL